MRSHWLRAWGFEDGISFMTLRARSLERCRLGWEHDHALAQEQAPLQRASVHITEYYSVGKRSQVGTGPLWAWRHRPIAAASTIEAKPGG